MGTHPIFESDFDCLTEMSDQKLKRTNRSTAGNRYRQALATDLDEEEREFFSTTYGGFTEEKDDDDFRDSSSETDESISSSSEPESEPEEVDEPVRERKKRKMVYKEPSKAKNRLTGMKQVEKSKKKKGEIPKEASRKSTRQSTVEQREKDEEYVEPKRKKYTRKVHKQLSQEQLLKAAMKMEEINLSQLVVYQKEEELRKTKSKKKKVHTISGPTIKTVSRIRTLDSEQTKKVAPPMVEEISNLIPDYNKKVNMKLENFVVFSSSDTFKETFATTKPKEKIGNLCRVTGKPARYRTRDGIPYYDSFAYKVIQEKRQK